MLEEGAPDHPVSLSILDEIYHLLDAVERDASQLRTLSALTKRLDVTEVPGLAEAVEFLQEQGFAQRLGLAEMDLYKFERWRGQLDARVCVKLAERSRQLLKEVEGEVRRSTVPPDVSAPSIEVEPEPANTFQAVAWVPTPRSSADLIAEIAALMEEVVYLAKTTNLPPDKAALTTLQRAQLIALLKTSLAVLEAPMTEKGLLKRAAEAAQAGATSAVQKQSEVALGYALNRLAQALMRLLGVL